ncbi:2-C-methyl-D-erythritol 4-phosphate cytidylyltransferase [Austwickia chelonae]|uniref:2-C-methyl-D-erythritol 4-phosphate cytidylyltransferase n=1 Tax=Austwickia chelonae TaxID=100225 RepID=UPI001F086993|nr:2-C-methyl-D-erythritol 4-phosphate cytidylyltransferase [Austwickia chelonae]
MAAGSGSRLGHDLPKAFVPLVDRPLLRHALDQVFSCPDIDNVVLVAPSAHLSEAQALLLGDEVDRVVVVPGGAERTQSVLQGLSAVGEETAFVLVHDAARCLAPASLFTRVIQALHAGRSAVIPGVPVVDTVKQVDDEGLVTGTPERSVLRAIQTPQGFAREVLADAHRRAVESGQMATDDAALVESCGVPVAVVPGDPAAAKITTPDDLAFFEYRLTMANGRDLGLGHDPRSCS